MGWTAIAPCFAALPTLADTPERGETAIRALAASLARAAAASGALVRRLTTLAQLTKTMFDAMEFGFLFDPTRQLFSIGYRMTDNSLDPGYYDLLASEARLTSFILPTERGRTRHV